MLLSSSVHRVDLSSELYAPRIKLSHDIVRLISLPSTIPAYARLSTAHHSPGTNLVVRVPSEKSRAIARPAKRNTLRLTALLAHLHVFRLEFINLALLLQVEDDDRAGSGGAEPVAVGREDKGVDLVAGRERVEVLGLVQIPEHGRAVFTAACAEGAVG